MPTSRRVLITGIHGFTGHYVARELQGCGHQVFGLGTHPSPEPGYYQADVLDRQGLEAAVDAIRPHWVVHLAAVAFVGHADPNDFYAINLIGTRNLLAALAGLDPSPECVLLASSANVYGRAARSPITEDTPPDPPNDYAVSKLAMERMAGLWTASLPLVITRPFNYTGLGQSGDFVLPKIVDHFRTRAPVMEMGNMDVSRDFSDVRSVALAYRRLLEEAPAGEVVNICSGRAVSLEEIIAMAASMTGHEVQVSINPAFVRRDDVKTLKGDPGKLRSLIGRWDPIPIEDTLRWMLRLEEGL
jgi:nucleoside-diphosphate-sugar epimerase